MVSGLSKLSAKIIEKTVSEVSRQQTFQTPAQGGSPFQEMLDTMSNGRDLADSMGMSSDSLKYTGQNMEAISAKGVTFEGIDKVGLGDPDGMQKVVGLLSEVNDGHMQMDNLVSQIMNSPKKFNNQELLAIQAHVYQFAQLTELVVKAADQGVSSIKAVLNTNVQ